MTSHIYKGLNQAIRHILSRHGKAVHYGEIYEIIRSCNSLPICKSPKFRAGLIKEHLSSAGGVLSFSIDELGYVTQKDSVNSKVAVSGVGEEIETLLAAKGIVDSYDAETDFGGIRIETGFRTRQFVPNLILRKGTGYRKHKDALYAKQNGRCASCQRKTRIELCDVDHVVAHSKGGSNDVDNLQVLCRDCNARKGSGGKKDRKQKPGFFGRLLGGAK